MPSHLPYPIIKCILFKQASIYFFFSLHWIIHFFTLLLKATCLVKRGKIMNMNDPEKYPFENDGGSSSSTDTMETPVFEYTPKKKTNRVMIINFLLTCINPFIEMPWKADFMKKTDSDRRQINSISWSAIRRWTRTEKGMRNIKKWIRSILLRIVIISFIFTCTFLVYRNVELSVQDKPDYIDSQGRVIRNSILHDIDGEPWKAYNIYQKEWINCEQTRFYNLNRYDRDKGYKPLTWYDGMERNVSLERFVKSMLSIAPNQSCICAAHMLVPFNVIRTGSGDQTSVLFNPVISIASERYANLCFKDDLFSHSHDQYYNHGIDKYDTEEVLPKSRYDISRHHHHHHHGNLIKRDDDDNYDEEINRKEKMDGINHRNSNTRHHKSKFIMNKEPGIHCETFPERILVDHQTYDDYNNRRTWFSSGNSACIVHCSSIASRSIIFNDEGQFYKDYVTRIHSE